MPSPYITDLSKYLVAEEKTRLKALETEKPIVPLNMAKTKTGYDENLYNLERVKEENSLIHKALSKETTNIELSHEQKAHLRNIRSRNKSHILLNQQKFLGDSKKMKSVKDRIAELEGLLANSTMSEVDLQKIDYAFGSAIEACNNYVVNKNPWFEKGKERKRLVEKRQRALYKEQNCFQLARKHIKEHKEAEVKSPLDLLELGRVLMAKDIEDAHEYQKKRSEMKQKEKEKKPQKKNAKPNDWIKYPESEDASWKEYVAHVKSNLESKNDKTGAMIKDKEADQKVLEALCKHWTFLNRYVSKGDKNWKNVPAEDKEKIFELVEQIGKAFDMDYNNPKAELREYCRTRYHLGNVADFLFPSN